MNTARNRDIVIAYETFGPPDGAPLLLIAGTGAQMLIWPDDFCAALAGRGFQVARFDNRDAGLSTHLTGTPAPGWLKTMFRAAAPPYRLDDMAEDALAVMDALGWQSAHLAGASLGGMIAQALAIGHPSRVRTLTSIMSTPSARIATMPTITAMRAIARAGGTPVTDPDQAAEQAVALKRAIGSPGYPLDEPAVRDIGRRSFERNPGAKEAGLRQRAAIIASGDRRSALAGLRIPALVLHGGQDPVIRPRGGRATADAIPGAKLVTYPGMGHDLPRALWPSMLDQIFALAAQAEAAPPRAARPGPVTTGPQPGTHGQIHRWHAPRMPGAPRGLAQPADETASRAKGAEALRLVSVRKVYRTAGHPVTALDGVTLSLAPGSFTAVMGPSGSGKSTLLQCAAGLDTPTEGQVFIDGARVTGGSEAELAKFRRQRIGFVFQQFNLLPALTVLQNVALPLRLAGRKVNRAACVAILERVGLGGRLEHRPAELSAGQQQRTAIARALVTGPAAILADEPTGALDSRSARDVLVLLREAVQHFGQTVVMVTHDPVAASYADSVLFLADGRIEGQLDAPAAGAVAERMTLLGEQVARRQLTAGA
jgi:putative ABC transport system ATP-binding protein